jgi:hypothetical protein
LFQFQAGQPSVENPIGRLVLPLAWAFNGAANKCGATVAIPAAALIPARNVRREM